MQTLYARNGRRLLTNATVDERTAAILRGAPVYAGQPAFNVGNVAPVNAPSVGMPVLDFFQVTLNNTCSNAVTYIIGDSNGMLEALATGTWADPTACSSDGTTPGTGVIPMKQLFGLRGIAASWFNYGTSSRAAQFTQNIRRVSAEVDGTLSYKPVNLFMNRRNNQFDELLMTLDFTANPLIFNAFNGLLVTVLGDESVTLAFNPGMVAG